VSQISKQPEGDPLPRLLVADCVRDMGGGERFVLDLARYMPERGWRVTVLAYPGAPLHQACVAEDLPVRTARTRANGAPWTVFPLVAWMRQHRVDLLLTEFDKDLRTAGLAARLSHQDIRIIHSRECDGPIKDRAWIRGFHTWVADRILVASAATQRSTVLSAPWLDPNRVSIVGKGIPLEPLAGVRPVGDGPLRLGYLGQLVERKRVDVLLRSLQAAGLTSSLRIAGRGAAESALRALVEECGLADRVIFDGFVTDLPGWFGKIDALVLPSLAEGWGYVLAEAAAAGRLVLAYQSSSVAEVTPAEAGALLVDPAIEGSLVAGLRELADLDATERRARAESLRSHARSRLGLDRMLDELDTLFRQTLSTPR
jgi:glycosyltransferase involved in cell wall biosynthesis